MRMSPILGSPCWYRPPPIWVPLSLTTEKLRLVCCAQTCAARRIWFCQTLVAHFALNVANRLLVTPPRFVPSGTKLMVTRCGFGQALPETAYSARRDSSCSTQRRVRWVCEERDFGRGK